MVELKFSLTSALKRARTKRHLSQIELAQRMGSSQSRVAKIEPGDPTVSLDLIVRALLAKLGLGSLPGDNRFERKGHTFYFPLTSSIIVSIVISLILWILRR